MMDHARHISSPSPTSPFLFHHSERSFKSTTLTPLLSSTADVTSVDDCFSTSSNISHQSHHHNPFGVDQHHSLVDNHNHHHHHHHHHHHSNHHQRHGHDQCVIDQDSLTGVDDDDGMHNMLSGSSTSSNSTIPLLTESHPHHSFSRISLEEYSPLSLVEDCDNALPISPTSLACGSHHSFKSSLNGLKMGNLVEDVGVHDHDDHEVVHDDARSMSPTLLSSSSNNHHNLWSNSSTAITQNTSLLNSSSTSFLLSQHHQNQLNSLIQQLEPQSLDEPPPLVAGGNSSNNFEMNPHSTMLTHRPSSEPLPGAGLEIPEVGCKSMNIQPLQPKSKQPSVKAAKNNSSANPQVTTPATIITAAAAITGVASTTQPVTASSSTSATSAPIGRSKRSRSRSTIANNLSNKGRNSAKKSNSSNSSTFTQQQDSNSSKLHLQLNHHKKLQELQKRLFGTTTDDSNENNARTVDNSKPNKRNLTSGKYSTSATKKQDSASNQSSSIKVKEEPDSSGSVKEDESGASDKVLKTTNQTSSSNSKSRSVPIVRSRRSRAVKNETCHSSASSALKSAQKLETSETVEPDTTTKSSDCIKLADLLSSNNNNSNAIVDSKSVNGLIVTNQGSNDIGEKRVQQIQLQVSPSLTVVANGGLMQPISIQQPQQPGNGVAITTSGATFANQILCRPQTVVASTGNNGNQLKGAMSNNDQLKGGETILSNWSVQQATNNNINGGNNNSATIANTSQTIGAHQIAIQVICQDGTSLVLPVSSAAGLSAAVSLTSQHQQLQAVMANQQQQQQSQSQQQQRGQTTNQILPLLSVSNIVAQQQMNTISVDSATNNVNSSSSNNQNSAGTQTTSGLAASSPTLAALLDAGSSRNNNDLNNGNFNSQSFVSTNLLRKLVSGSSNNEQQKRGESTLQIPGLSLTNCASLVTVCTTNNTNNDKTNSMQNNKYSEDDSIGSGDKRLKLDHGHINGATNNTTNMQATSFTLIDPQGLVVANGNAEKPTKQVVQTSTSSSGSTIASMQQTNAIIQDKVTNSDGTASQATVKQNKMGSSTGNRQVDPTQPFRCEHCNSTFTRLGNFTRHKKIHTVPTKDGQRFKCDVCSKSFLQRCDLARHLHIHRGTEPHRCNICGKGYIRHSDLVTHQRFHNKEKPFGCSHCSKGFCQRGDLNRHLRSIHLQMKPILCPCCNRKFAKQETLLRHLNTAHRSKPGATTNGVIAELPPNYTLTQGDDKQTKISVVNNAAVLNNNNIAQKNAPVASLQAIQATLCKVPLSVDPSTTSGFKAVQPTAATAESSNTAKVVS